MLIDFCHLMALCAALVSPAQPREHLWQSVPEDVLAAVYADAVASDEGSTSAMGAATVVSRLQQWGMVSELNSGWQVVLELAACWPMVRQYPGIVCIHELELTPLGTSSQKLSKLSASIILETKGETSQLHAQIQRYIEKYTSSRTTQMKRVEYQGTQCHRLIDARLPEWAVCEWTEVGSQFILCIGDGNLRKIIETISAHKERLSSQQWFQEADAATLGARSRLQAYINLRRAAQNLPIDARQRWLSVLHCFGIHQSEQFFWSVSYDGKAVISRAFVKDGQDFQNIYFSVSPFEFGEFTSQVAPETSWQTYMRMDAGMMIRRLACACLEVYGDAYQQSVARAWNEALQAVQVNFDEDVLGQLGDRIVIYDYPPHPLRLPLMYTILIEITGDSKRVSTTLDRLLEYAGARMTARSGEDAGGFTPQLLRTPEGIWYLQLGLYAPAVVVQDRWLIISYSPMAAQMNAHKLRSTP